MCFHVSSYNEKLFLKRKTFSQFPSAVSKSRLNSEHFRKKDNPHSLFISD